MDVAGCGEMSSPQQAARACRRVFIHTFGCQMNKLDSELVLAVLGGHGYAPAVTAEEADVILFNTCSVRQRAEEKVYSRLGLLRTAKQRRPELVIGVLGCMAQRAGEEILRRVPHVDFVCGTGALARLPTLIEEAAAGRRLAALEMNGGVDIRRQPGYRPLKHQAYVSIMRGCDNYCSYCVVPYLRGPEVSRQPEDILAEVQMLAADGCREIILLGQTVNAYGKSLGRPGVSLATLLAQVGAIAGIARVRFITSHPAYMTPELLEAMAVVPTVCEHLHLPAQSGSNRILQAMNRRYTREEYLDIVARARERVPGITFASDFIVGFPGETEADFEATADLVRQVHFQNCFIFRYSPRPGTRAATLPDDVPPREKARRNQILLKIQEEISRVENERLIGQVVEILVDGPSETDASRLHGRTRHNHIVVLEPTASGHCVRAGDLIRVRITACTPLTLFGTVVRGWDSRTASG